VWRCFKLLSGNKVATGHVAADQAAVFIKRKNDLDAFKAEVVTHQCFVGCVTALVVLAEIILQIQASFDDLTTICRR
jgi:hypothetical protein